MALAIRTTGVEDYVDGSANIRMLVIGSPGSGKTRMASFWPKPIYADCESGRASLADRQMPYTEIRSSQDMLDFLSYLKGFERMPRAERPYRTAVIDTLDGFQRKVFDERLLATKKETFSGFDDWGYLDSKMQMLMTRLLNLDMNVIVNCHFKDKAIKDGANESRELMLQLKGDIKDTAMNDFDLVGWIGTYWAAEGGERVEKRGLSFQRTPDRPFLKDRTGSLPNWVPITLTSTQDYEFIRDALMAKLDGLSAGEVVGEIPSVDPDADVKAVASGGPLPPQKPREIPLHQHDKATLMQLCRAEGVTTSVDGTPLKANSTKGELLQALEHARANANQPPAESDSESASLTEVPEAPAEPAEPVEQPVADVTPATADVDEPTQVAVVDTSTGEIAPETPVGDVVEAPVVIVPSPPTVADNTSVTPTPAPAGDADTCEQEGCDVALSTQNGSYVQLAQMRFHKRLCGAHYIERRQALSAS